MMMIVSHRQYNEFLEDLEEDELLRKNVNIFRGDETHRTSLELTFWLYSYQNHVPCTDTSKIPVESDTDDDGAPRISLAEMLEDLSLNDATGGEGADMMTDSWTYELESGVRWV